MKLFKRNKGGSADWSSKEKFEFIFGQLDSQYNRTDLLKDRVENLERCLDHYISKVYIIHACLGNPEYKLIPPENVPTLSSEELNNYSFKGYHGLHCLYVHKDSQDLIERITRFEKSAQLTTDPKGENS